MKKADLLNAFNKFLESLPDDEETTANETETESIESNEEVETVENTVETESTESNETVVSTETVEVVRSVTENGDLKLEEKRIYVDKETGDYMYR